MILTVDNTPQPAGQRPGGGGHASPAPPGGLDETALAADPFDQFARWLADAVAAGLPEPNAMVLATVSADGWPRARMVLLKQHGPDGFTFYTNRTSRKGQDLSACPRASLVFPWHALRRQVIVEGAVSALSQADSEPYFRSRPHGSQVGAWASRQSSVIESRDALDSRYAELQRRWPPGAAVPMPDFWGGYRVAARVVEFWQGRDNRLHDRLRYRWDRARWVVERLSP